MSDHEAGAQDDWQEGTLPGTPAIGTSYANSESLVKPSHHQGNRLVDRSNARVPRGPRRGGFDRPAQYSDRPPTSGIPGRTTGVESRQARPGPSQLGEAALCAKRGNPPTKTYVLSVTWSTFLTNIGVSTDTPPPKLARLRLNEIAESTETYIETPALNSTEIFIWGSEDQVSTACDRLRLWEREVRETGVRPHRFHWVKQNAHDGRVEEREARQKAATATAGQYKAFGESLDHSAELCLLWPESIGLEDFQDEYGKTISDLEDAYDCRILCNRLHSMVQVFAHQDVKALQVLERLINIGREMIARRNEVIRLNVLRYPKPTSYRHHVQLTEDKNSVIFLPSLCGPTMPQNLVNEYETFSKTVNHKTRLKIRRLVEKGLTGHLQLSSKHVRMRVTFLEQAFRQYKRPSGDKAHHEFSEYVDMVGDERTAIESRGLRTDSRDLRQLGDKITSHLGQPVTAYSVHFDFGMDPVRRGSTLRFECDLRPSFLEGEVETVGQRWLEHRSDAEDDLLLINVLDFERPGYQIVIRAVPFPENQAIKGEMDLFTRSVEFSPPAEGIKAPPKRRAKFPPGRQTLNKVSEMTILRYNHKNEGVFELRRRDTYLVNSSSKEITTDWSACYYYPEWDNMMGEFGDLKPGQDVAFKRSVASFFPVQNHEKPGAGLKRFTNEIEELQALLAICIEELPQVGIDSPQGSK